MEDKSIKTATGYEIRVNSGNLFKNNSENPKAPAFRGLCNIDGRGFDVALRRTEKGYLNVKFTEHKISEDGTKQEYKYDNKTTNLTPDQAGKIISEDMNKKDEFNDDIPF